MEHEEVERLLKSGNEPISLQTRRLILAEFDRLKLRVAALAADLWDANAARDEAQAENERIDKIVKATVAQWNRDVQELAGTIDTLQSWLGRICELAKPSLEFVGARIAATDLRQQGWKTIPDLLETIAAYLESKQPTPYRPTVVCLCGSTRFSKAFQDAQLRETLAGKIVLTIGCNMRSDTEIFGQMEQKELDGTKCKLDELHLRKIDMADEVLILDVNGYLGKSTTNELNYAKAQGKRIRFLSQEEKPSEKPKPCENKYCIDGKVWLWGDGYDCPICNPKHLCNDGIWEYIPKSECQRCNPPKVTHGYASPVGMIWHEGHIEDCPICKPKCEHKNAVISQPVLIDKYFRES